MSKTPPDWVLIEAVTRGGWVDTTPYGRKVIYKGNQAIRALCDMIERYEQPPVDRKLLCAEEARRQIWAEDARSFTHDNISIRAIELWEEGFGK